MIKAVTNFLAKLVVKACYNTGVNSVNYASHHYMYEPEEPKSLNKYKN